MLCAVAVLGCKQKFEIVPDGAQSVQRKDFVESLKNSNAKVIRRDYQFIQNGSLFVCESHEFTRPEDAQKAAKEKIAERPTDELKNSSGRFAQSGRSLWLYTKNKLLWCMLASGKDENIAEAIKPVRASFIAELKKEGSP